MEIRVQSESFQPGAELDRFSASVSHSGAIVSFSGIVRDVAGGLDTMEIETYPGMVEKALAKIAAQAQERWSLENVLVIHRHGPLKAKDVIMMVATASRHRKHAFEAAEFLMDYLKSRAPFWKKETTVDGESWVDSKDEDETALDRWDRD